MPRKNKVILRQRRDAAAEWKKGNKKEAYEAWTKAAAARKGMRDAKKNKGKAADAAAPAS